MITSTILKNEFIVPLVYTTLQELAGQAQQSTGTSSSTDTTTLTLQVHLESHLGGTVDSRLLVTLLRKRKKKRNRND